jgi:hypothetical protein
MMKMYHEKYDILKEQCDICKSSGTTEDDCAACEKRQNITEHEQRLEAEKDGGCPLGGDIANDCAGCAYAWEYHYVGGECVRREEN